VRKLHKVSDKPAATLGFRTFGVVPKEPHPKPCSLRKRSKPIR